MSEPLIEKNPIILAFMQKQKPVPYSRMLLRADEFTEAQAYNKALIECAEIVQKAPTVAPEQPHWVSVKQPPKWNGAFAACCVYDGKIYWFKAIYIDGKWLRDMDGVELPVNYWMEIPQPSQEVQDGSSR